MQLKLHSGVRIALLLTVLLLGAFPVHAQDGGTKADEDYIFGACAEHAVGRYGTGPIRSLHVPMRDGVRIALDVVLPEGLAEREKVPTVLHMTRFWRATEEAGPHPVQQFYTRHGYAVVAGDVRGTGASFGVWPHHRARDETLDFGEIIDWIAAQPWSDGRVAGFGSSYTANTVDWMVERGRPAFRAAVSRFPDYDPYVDLYFPGGVPNVLMGRIWGLELKQMDLNTPRELADGRRVGVRPVDADVDGTLVRAAVEARREVPSVWEGLQQVTFKDDAPEGWGGWSMDDWGIHAWKYAVEAAGTPIYSWGSWMDAGTANGVLRRFMTLSNPQRVVVGPWSHGAVEDASPYRPVDMPVDPPADRQRLEELCWLEQWVRSAEAGMADRLLVYYTMGEKRWKTATEWPLPGTVHQDWFFRADGLLAPNAPPEPDGTDSYQVDFEATTGTRNRWATQTTGGDVVYGDRAAADERLLVYDSEPLPADLEITGQPIVMLHVTSTHDDGAFFVYLEDVALDGTVRYVTEGMLRAIHHKVSEEPPPYRMLGPYHSFRRADAMTLVPGEAAELAFEMMPTSVLIRAGHRIRIAIAGADADTFRRVPETGRPVIRVHRSTALPSRVMLPVVPHHNRP